MLDIQSMRKTESKPFDEWSDKEKMARFIAVAKADGGFFKETDPPTLLDRISWQLLLKLMEPYYTRDIGYDNIKYAMEKSEMTETMDGYVVTNLELSCKPQNFRWFLYDLRRCAASCKIIEGELSYEDSICCLDMLSAAKHFLCCSNIDSISYLRSILNGDTVLDEEAQLWFSEYRKDIRDALNRPRLLLSKGTGSADVESNYQGIFTTRLDVCQTIMEVCHPEVGCINCKFSINGVCIFEQTPKNIENVPENAEQALDENTEVNKQKSIPSSNLGLNDSNVDTCKAEFERYLEMISR